MNVHWRWLGRPGFFPAAVLQWGCVVQTTSSVKTRAGSSWWWFLRKIKMSWTNWTAMSMGNRRFWWLVMLVIAATRLRGVITWGRSTGSYRRTFMGKYEVTWAFGSVWKFWRSWCKTSSWTVHCHRDHFTLPHDHHFTLHLQQDIVHR